MQVILPLSSQSTFCRMANILFRPRRTYSPSVVFLAVEFRVRSVRRSVCPSVRKKRLNRSGYLLGISFGAVGPRNDVFDGVQIPHGKGQLWREMGGGQRNVRHRGECGSGDAASSQITP